MMFRAGECRAAREADGAAQLVSGSSVGGRELGLLAPGAAGAHERVGGAGILETERVPALCTDQGRAGREGDGGAEGIVRRRAGLVEFLLLRPDGAAAREDVGGASARCARDVVRRRAH